MISSTWWDCWGSPMQPQEMNFNDPCCESLPTQDILWFYDIKAHNSSQFERMSLLEILFFLLGSCQWHIFLFHKEEILSYTLIIADYGLLFPLCWNCATVHETNTRLTVQQLWSLCSKNRLILDFTSTAFWRHLWWKTILIQYLKDSIISWLLSLLHLTVFNVVWISTVSQEFAVQSKLKKSVHYSTVEYNNSLWNRS